MVGIEVDPDRVELAQRYVEPGLAFVRGGFELPTPDGRRPVLVRALNVLRQYAETDVPGAWATMVTRLAPEGRLVEGTCDELGRLAAWVTLDSPSATSAGSPATPRTLTVSVRAASIERPSQIAERLPKALIHRNVPGERVHAFLAALDSAWERAAAYAAFGPRQRWVEAVARLREEEWPIVGGRSRWRLGELTVGWESVAPEQPRDSGQGPRR